MLSVTAGPDKGNHSGLLAHQISKWWKDAHKLHFQLSGTSLSVRTCVKLTVCITAITLCMPLAPLRCEHLRVHYNDCTSLVSDWVTQHALMPTQHFGALQEHNERELVWARLLGVPGKWASLQHAELKWDSQLHSCSERLLFYLTALKSAALTFRTRTCMRRDHSLTGEEHQCSNCRQIWHQRACKTLWGEWLIVCT